MKKIIRLIGLCQYTHIVLARRRYMKHVVLDQDPALQEYFTPDEWSWNISSLKVQKLLADVRSELYELFGTGSYMHLGFDEADYYTGCKEARKYLPGYLHDMTHEVVKKDRRPMVWIDMMLDKEQFPGMTAHCPTADVETLHNALHPDTVMIDWQYRVKEAAAPERRLRCSSQNTY